jgi:hypothetical protein
MTLNNEVALRVVAYSVCLRPHPAMFSTEQIETYSRQGLLPGSPRPIAEGYGKVP